MATTVNVGPGSGGVGTAQVSITVTYAFGSNPAANIESYEVKDVNGVLFEETVNLAPGANAVTIRSNNGAVMIIPPSANAQTLAAAGDAAAAAGEQIKLHKTAPTILALETGATLQLFAGGAINGVKLVWI